MTQILRVRIINAISKPYFSIGLRSGIFMNGIGFLLNIITPFRLGEIFRYLFLSRKSQAPKSLILASLTIERTVDSILILTIFIFLGSNIAFFNIYFLVMVLVMELILFSILMIIVKSNLASGWQLGNNFPTNLFITREFLIKITGKKLMKIFSLAFIVWSLYFLTAWLLYKLWHVDFNNWILWNLSPYRGASSLYDVKDKFFFLNLIFVLPVLSLGILLAFLPHFNSSLLRRIRGENSDSTNSGNFHNKQIIDIKRKRRFFRNSSEYYFQKKTTNFDSIDFYSGGSGAVVYQDTEGKYAGYLTKIAFGVMSFRLEEQYNFINNVSRRWKYPRVFGGTFGLGYFHYNIEKLDGYINPVKLLSRPKIANKQIEKCMSSVFQYLDEDPERMSESKIFSSDAKKQLNQLWQIKVEDVIDSLRITAPEYFISSTVTINSKEFLNLEGIVKVLGERVRLLNGFPQSFEIHGDATLANIFLDETTGEVIGIDPNPDQIYKSVVVDHGKILQSLWAQYDYQLEFGIVLSEIQYVCNVPNSLGVALSFYRELLIVDSKKLEYSELMCFISIIRLLPYRVRLDRARAAIFFAKAIEVGSILIEKDWSIIDR